MKTNRDYYYIQQDVLIRVGEVPDACKDMLSLCDRTPTSVQVIAANVEYAKYVFKNNEDILQQFAQEQNVEKYTIHWRSDNPDIQLREGYTVEVH